MCEDALGTGGIKAVIHQFKDLEKEINDDGDGNAFHLFSLIVYSSLEHNSRDAELTAITPRVFNGQSAVALKETHYNRAKLHYTTAILAMIIKILYANRSDYDDTAAFTRELVGLINAEYVIRKHKRVAQALLYNATLANEDTIRQVTHEIIQNVCTSGNPFQIPRTDSIQDTTNLLLTDLAGKLWQAQSSSDITSSDDFLVHHVMNPFENLIKALIPEKTITTVTVEELKQIDSERLWDFLEPLLGEWEKSPSLLLIWAVRCDQPTAMWQLASLLDKVADMLDRTHTDQTMTKETAAYRQICEQLIKQAADLKQPKAQFSLVEGWMKKNFSRSVKHDYLDMLLETASIGTQGIEALELLVSLSMPGNAGTLKQLAKLHKTTQVSASQVTEQTLRWLAKASNKISPIVFARLYLAYWIATTMTFKPIHNFTIAGTIPLTALDTLQAGLNLLKTAPQIRPNDVLGRLHHSHRHFISGRLCQEIAEHIKKDHPTTEAAYKERLEWYVQAKEHYDEADKAKCSGFPCVNCAFGIPSDECKECDWVGARLEEVNEKIQALEQANREQEIKKAFAKKCYKDGKKLLDKKNATAEDFCNAKELFIQAKPTFAVQAQKAITITEKKLKDLKKDLKEAEKIIGQATELLSSKGGVVDKRRLAHAIKNLPQIEKVYPKKANILAKMLGDLEVTTTASTATATNQTSAHENPANQDSKTLNKKQDPKKDAADRLIKKIDALGEKFPDADQSEEQPFDDQPVSPLPTLAKNHLAEASTLLANLRTATNETMQEMSVKLEDIITRKNYEETLTKIRCNLSTELRDLEINAPQKGKKGNSFIAKKAAREMQIGIISKDVDELLRTISSLALNKLIPKCSLIPGWSQATSPSKRNTSRSSCATTFSHPPHGGKPKHKKKSSPTALTPDHRGQTYNK